MKRVSFIIATFAITAMLCASCEQKPEKNPNVFTSTEAYNTTENNNKTEDIADNELAESENETVENIQTESEEINKEEIVPEEIDTHVYTADELNDELIKSKLIGYWEFNSFGYIGGYNFFESGFLQLVLEREVDQTGIFMVRNKGVYFSLDSKSWDEDVLVIQSVSHEEIRGTFGDDMLVLKRADESLIKKNSGITLNSSDQYSSVVDAATEVNTNVKVN